MKMAELASSLTMLGAPCLEGILRTGTTPWEHNS